MGPTGVGKTDLAMDLYEQIPIEIISVDSVQIYKNLDIGSGKPSKEVLKTFPHEMIDIIECSENYSTAKFQNDCLACIKKAFDGDKIPVLVSKESQDGRTTLSYVSVSFLSGSEALRV